MEIKMINSIITHSDIMVWWDFFDKKEDKESYFVYLNGEEILTTDKTHFTLRDVKEKNSTVEIYSGEGKKNLFFKKDFVLEDAPKIIDVTKPPYNAVGDGKALNTKALQAAIDDCGVGECVYIPEGVFITGALRLHSNMELFVSENAEIRGSASPEDYLPKIWSRFEGMEMECYSSLINIGDINGDRDKTAAENILIHGGGKIFGGGRPLALAVLDAERARLEADPSFEYDPECENNNTIPGRPRPKLINISRAKNVVLENLDVGHGSCWNVHMIYSKNIVTANCRFHSFDVWNGDGWDPDSSDGCTLFGSDFYTGDDCVAIKSGKNPEGNEIDIPSKNIRVFDCRASFGHSFAVGSEMSGGVENVYIWDCDFAKTIYGLEIKGTKKRGGYVKNVFMKNCRVPRIMMHSVKYNDDGIAAPTVPFFGDCRFEDITITAESCAERCEELSPCTAIELRGFDDEHKVENVVFENITIDNERSAIEQTISLETLKNVSFINLNVR